MLPKVVEADELGNFYVVTFAGDLLWFGDRGAGGSTAWAPRSGDRIGTGWHDIRCVTSGGDGVLYAVSSFGELYFYRDKARSGRVSWASGTGGRIGTGWNDMRLVFGGGNGTLYAVREDGALLWYRDLARDGTASWAPGSGSAIGSGWERMRFAWADVRGVIYAVRDDGLLFWYRDARQDGTAGWAENSGSSIGSGWSDTRVAFGGAPGTIYGISRDGLLRRYQDAKGNGTTGWAAGSGEVIGSGWNDVRYAAPLSGFGNGTYRANGAAASGKRQLLIVLAEYDNNPQNEFPPFPTDASKAGSPDFYRRLGFGSPTPPFTTTNPVNPASLAAYLRENSCGTFTVVPLGPSGVAGPVRVGVAWSDGDQIEVRGERILKALAARNLAPWHAADSDSDGTVEDDELCLILVENFRRASPLQPANRTVRTEVVLRDGVKKKINLNVSFVGPLTPFYQIAHELAHSLGLPSSSDLRGYGNSNNLLTLMAGYSFGSNDQRSVHLDGFHKHVLGWSRPRVHSIELPGETEVAITSSSSPDAPVLLWSTSKGKATYLLLEYRSSDPRTGLAYDEAVAGAQPSSIQEGLAVWRVPGIPASGRAAEHLGSPKLTPAGSELWNSGALSPEIDLPAGDASGTRIAVGAIDKARNSINVCWWGKNFPLRTYRVESDGRLIWQCHYGALVGAGLASWGVARQIGGGWQSMQRIIPSDDGIIYAIDDQGRLLWYKHRGWRDGGGPETWDPQPAGHSEVGVGWGAMKHVVWAGESVLYAVNQDGQLLWYRHDGHRTGGGLATWAGHSGKVVGVGWGDMRHILSAGDGLLYAIDLHGQLLWFRHQGFRHGGGLETWDPVKVVGTGWGDTRLIFWGGQGLIYAIGGDGRVRWYRHRGWQTGDGLGSWHPQDTGFRVVADGWQTTLHAFAMQPF